MWVCPTAACVYSIERLWIGLHQRLEGPREKAAGSHVQVTKIVQSEQGRHLVTGA